MEFNSKHTGAAIDSGIDNANTAYNRTTNINNTSDMNKPVSTAQAAALALKVDKVTGKSLVSDTEISRLTNLTNFDNTANVTALAGKLDIQQNVADVDKVMTVGIDGKIIAKTATGGVINRNLLDVPYETYEQIINFIDIIPNWEEIVSTIDFKKDMATIDLSFIYILDDGTIYHINTILLHSVQEISLKHYSTLQPESGISTANLVANIYEHTGGATSFIEISSPNSQINDITIQINSIKIIKGGL